MLAPLCALALLLSLATPALAQKKAADVCTVCKNDPKLYGPAGQFGHGQMPFGKSTAGDLRKFLIYANPIFIETKHFRICLTLEGFTVPENDWKSYEGELLKMSKAFPAVRPKERTLDPWMRLHLFAQRCEERYERFLKLMKMTDADFYARQLGKPYRGEGPYLGMKDKFEVVLLKNMREFTDTLRDQSGSMKRMTKREHFVNRGVLSVFIPCEGDLKPDDQLWAHIAHNLGHNFILGFKYYSYEPPKWFEEGFAHFMEKEVNDHYNSFDSEEAALAEMTHAEDWRAETLKILGKGKAAGLADLVHKKTFSDITKEDHVIIWSKVEYLVKVHGDKFALFLDQIRGRLNKEGFPDGSDLIGVQRNSFKSEIGLSFAEFDREWEKWVQKAYLFKEPSR
jgi:hypothetical protein